LKLKNHPRRRRASSQELSQEEKGKQSGNIPGSEGKIPKSSKASPRSDQISHLQPTG
jgi:hypothetical protein